jgi:hypothetical protein
VRVEKWTDLLSAPWPFPATAAVLSSRIPAAQHAWSVTLSEFVDAVRHKYRTSNPMLSVVLGCGPMNHQYCAPVSTAVELQRRLHPEVRWCTQAGNVWPTDCMTCFIVSGGLTGTDSGEDGAAGGV